jgi:hypothetical protein
MPTATSVVPVRNEVVVRIPLSVMSGTETTLAMGNDSKHTNNGPSPPVPEKRVVSSRIDMSSAVHPLVVEPADDLLSPIRGGAYDRVLLLIRVHKMSHIRSHISYHDMLFKLHE